jgi:parallel beta-helix repeat protein
MRNYSVFLLLFFCFSSLIGIEVSGNVSGIWSAENNPYEIIGDITILEGEQLEIIADVYITVMGDYQITVEGKIIVSGTVNLPVVMDAEGDGILWKGIRLENEIEESTFFQCYISNAEEGINSINSPVSITDCYFNDNEQAIHVFGIGNPNPPAVLVSGCMIENCQQNGIYIVENSNAVVSNNIITSCAMDESPRGAIMLSSQGGYCSPTINNNFIHHNIWQGISAWDITGGLNINPLIENNEISYNLTGIYLYFASGTIKNNHIHHNFVSGNANSGAGIMLQGSSTNPVCTLNEIHNNFCAVYLYQQATGNFGNLENDTNTDDGENHFYDNWDESGNLWSIYNASSVNVHAQNNIWDSTEIAEIQATIMDGNDNSAYGFVDFLPIYQETDNSVSEITANIHHGNYPNPFNPETIIFFHPKSDLEGEIAIYNLKGQKIDILFRGKLAGNVNHEFVWNATDMNGNKVGSGIYFYQINTKSYTITKKMLLLE